MLWLLALLAILAGALIPIQAGVNASLRYQLGHPVLAAIGNFAIGGTLLIVFALLMRVPAPSAVQLAKTPWWCWLGGTMGALLVLSGVIFSHRLGAAAFIACIILGQLTASVVADHFGWVGYAERAVSLWRLVGIGFLALGAYLIRTH